MISSGLAFSDLVPYGISACVLYMLYGYGQIAWEHRHTAWEVWSAIGTREVGTAVSLMALALGSGGFLYTAVPTPMQLGLGDAVGMGREQNVIFAPLNQAENAALGKKASEKEDVEEALARGSSGPEEAGSRKKESKEGKGGLLGGLFRVGATLFIGYLVLLMPSICREEERLFRSGLEENSFPEEVGRALLFGMAHALALIPLGFCLALSVVGFLFGRVYLKSYRDALRHLGQNPSGKNPAGEGRSVLFLKEGSGRAPGLLLSAKANERSLPGGRSPAEEQASAEALLRSAALHTTYNTIILGVFWTGLVF